MDGFINQGIHKLVVAVEVIQPGHCQAQGRGDKFVLATRTKEP